MAKKKSKGAKNKKHSKDKIIVSGEYYNLVTVFVGIFLLYSLNSNSMGLIGQFIQDTFKGLFEVCCHNYSITNNYYRHSWIF